MEQPLGLAQECEAGWLLAACRSPVLSLSTSALVRALIGVHNSWGAIRCRLLSPPAPEGLIPFLARGGWGYSSRDGGSATPGEVCLLPRNSSLSPPPISLTVHLSTDVSKALQCRCCSKRKREARVGSGNTWRCSKCCHCMSGIGQGKWQEVITVSTARMRSSAPNPRETP